MSSNERRAAARRRAWGRGPHILRFEPLEGRQLLSIATSATSSSGAPDLVAVAFDTLHDMDWGDTFHAVGTIQNQGTATTTVPFNVDVYASTSTSPDSTGIYVGTATIPAGLAPGASAQFNQMMQAPPAPLPDLGSSSSYYLDLVVDANNAVGAPASETSLAQRSLPYSVVTVMPHAQANLVANGFTTDSSTASWGNTITVSGQIVNNGQGVAPATRAAIVLTAQGQTAGGGSDFTLGSISVPSLGAYQGTQVSGTFTLPAHPPAVLGGASNLTVTLIPDVGYQTRPALSAPALQGFGIDSALLQMNTGATALPTSQQPNLSVASVQLPSTTVTWSQPFQVNASIKNSGGADAGPFLVRYLFVDANRPNATPLAIADVTVAGLKAGASQDLTQTLSLQGALPSGVIPADIAGHVVVQVDPENSVDEPSNPNSILASGAVTVRLVSDPPITTTPASSTTTAPSTTSTSTTQNSTTSASHPAQTTSTGTTTPKATTSAKHTTHPTRTRTVRVHPAHTVPAPRKHTPAVAKTAARPRLRVFGGGGS
jgi:hypothetical protein